MLLTIQVGTALIILLLAFAFPGIPLGFRKSVVTMGSSLARRKTTAVILVGVAAPLIRLLLLPYAPIPKPAVHDEFSYLLAADTFASGRLTNPTHPMWTHFETIHEDQVPTYMSMYPPAQGLMLAMGKVLAGDPWYGVCISVGLMCAAICWMLQGWLPPGWAFLGGILSVFQIGIFSYWMNAYWGGAVPAASGALVLGALPRLLRTSRAPIAVTLALGLAVLANSRPFEGLLLSAPVAVVLIAWSVGKTGPSFRTVLYRIALPIVSVLLLSGAAMAYYNWRVFGNPLTLPYQINRATYAVSPVFLWESPGPEPLYRYKEMREFYVSWELPVFQHARSLGGFLAAVLTKLGLMVAFYWGAVLLIPMVMFRHVVVDRRTRPLLLITLVFLVGESANPFCVPHYLSPITSVLFAVAIQGMRHLRAWRPYNEPVGRSLVSLVPAAVAFLCITHVVLAPRGAAAGLGRAEIQSQLSGMPGRQLAIVRYSPEHHPMDVEWVYNDANIDAQRVVWARDSGPAENLELIRYFKDRKVWLVEPDRIPPRVSPYVP